MVSVQTSATGDRQTRRRLFDADQRALRDLFEQHAESVLSVALAVTGDRQIAGEITRRVFAQLWRGRAALPSGFGPNMSARRWLETAAHAQGLAWRNGRHELERDELTADRDQRAAVRVSRNT